PAEDKRSLGTHAVLQQIWFSQLYQLPYVYLGYWIKDHPKMHYKNSFKPLQIFQQNQWVSDQQLMINS
ncbi:MAG: hypothetical protein OQK76_05025, partial [Gammaproteobacteria bacterium]|nr:hypothetical protein [Gammaproteobacteria bacterium]